MADSARLLIVDDEESVAVTLQAVLEREGFRVWTAGSASEVSALIDQQDFDVAVVDLRLNGANGIDVLALLRERQPDCVAVMLTGYASVESAIEAMRQGAYDYLIKPTDLDELKLTVMGAVERSAISRALRERDHGSPRTGAGTLAQELQQSLEQVTAEGVIVQDSSEKLTYANDAASQILGYPSPQALLDVPATEVLSKVDIMDEGGNPFPQDRLPWLVALKGVQSPSIVLRLRNRVTAEERAAMVRAAPVFDEKGQVQFVVSSFTDITERVRAVAGLRLLAETGELLASSLDYEVTLQRVVDLVVPALADWCSINLMNEEGQVARLVVNHADPTKIGTLQAYLGRRSAEPGGHRDGILDLFYSDRPQIYPEVSNTRLEVFSRDAEDLKVLREVGLKSLMVVPLEIEGRMRGSVTLVAAESGRRYDAQDSVLAQELARRCALAVETGRLHAAEQAARLRAEEAQRRTAAQYAVSRILAQPRSVDVAAPSILEAVGEHLGWDLGAFWIVEPQTSGLRCIDTWHAPSINADEYESATRRTTFWVGEGFPGRVLTSGEPLWVPDLLEEDTVIRAGVIAKGGLHGAVFFPIRGESGVVGVIEFLSREIREPDEDMLQTVAILGSQIGQFIERKQAEALIRELSTPILQIRERLLLLPIVGVVDSERAVHLTNRLLSSIRANRARVVVIDVTGVAFMDSYIANHLIRAIDAARLLGTSVIVTGISPDVTQALLRLGIDLTKLNTVGDLQSGIEAAERLMSYPGQSWLGMVG